ncbi:MAG: hypothetical protein IJ220_04715 [Clostridia bacterium]|nr:hypothetical protein [Clostridia bacterium]
MRDDFNIEKIVTKLKNKRKIFVSEADLQLEMAWIIKEEYPNSKVRLEYCPEFDPNMHIDILVITNGEWIPIELKYKTKGCTKTIDDEKFILKNHGAKDVNCYLYLKDIQRIESIRKNVPKFKAGYTIFVTNELSYLHKPMKENCVYKEFSLEEGIIKSGTLNWSEEASEGTKKNCEIPIELKAKYLINWKTYSKIDETNTGTFMYLVNEIKK